jgi:hypothetical protein
MRNDYGHKMKKHTNKQVVMISDSQSKKLAILRDHHVNVSQFIRSAIDEKMERDWPKIKADKDDFRVPF